MIGVTGISGVTYVYMLYLRTLRIQGQIVFFLNRDCACVCTLPSQLIKLIIIIFSGCALYDIDYHKIFGRK